MKIKKLAISGFKSFMDRLELPFPIGISAVVGPNGCGKSNIVDAIRWAMGEQSAKQLRGRQMEDVIFNGAGEFKPMGMAEVSIVLENGDGSFPAEFADMKEISVTRRLYRSGESEYLLNNVPCRLKDIQEIFMDTGLGNRAYSIIGQGRIGSIVDQKPEETRVMLEEAAGITKYKRKVAESQRKLELTRANLLRVEDILSEVQSQMRSLKRQASKAKAFKTIGQEIQRLELVLNSNMYHEFKEELAHRNRSTDDLVEQEVSLTTRFSNIQSQLENMSLDLDQKNSEISSLRQTYLSIKDAFNRKEAAIESLTNEKRMQQDLEIRLQNEQEDIQRRMMELDHEKISLEERIQNLKQAAVDLENETAMVDERLKTRKRLLQEIKEEYERAKDKVNSGKTKEAGLNQESGYLSKRIHEITDKRTRLEKEKEDAGLKMKDLLTASQGKNEIRQALVIKQQMIEQEIQEGQEHYEELARIEKNAEMELKKAEAELNICQTRLSSLLSLSENFEGYKVGVRTIMKADDLRPRNEGRIMGLIADIIKVEPRYEQALEAVLADKLQYIIVKTLDDGKEAIDYLKSKAKGRSSFAALNDLHPLTEEKGKDDFPLLRDLVSVSDPYRPLINLLLGNTTLVENLDQAITVWKNNGNGRCLVTLEGDMLDRTGVISGGKLANSAHGLLARKREIEELKEKANILEKDVQTLTDKLDSIQMEREEKKSALDRLMEEKSDCRDQVNDLDKVIFRLSHELDQLERLIQKISEDLDRETKEQARHQDALTKIESELKLHQDIKRKEEEYLSRKEIEMKETEEEFDEIRNEFEKHKMDWGLAREEEKGLTREIERIEDFKEESRERLQRIDADILSGREKIHDFTEREEALREELKGFYTKLEQAEQAVNQSEQDRNQFHAEIREQEKKAEKLREESDTLKDQINRTRMEQSEIKIKMENLEEKIRERLNLNLAEVYSDHLEADFSAPELRERLEKQKARREKLGEVNLTAIQEHEALKERNEFIQTQRQDLLNSIDSIQRAIRKINRTCLEKFMETFEDADRKLKEVFPILFNGGTAGLKLMDEANPLESGVLVEVRPPGKKVSHMGLLSGGEKALVAMALLFAIYLIKPSPFCLLDEVDAPLDEANIDRFNNLLQEIKKYSQVLMVTHNRRSMEIVDSLYGVTMEKAGVSKMVAVNLNEHSMN
ncbi:MAG: chromosome segregation protein SMC [Deltaproteobacteria bacterium]|nr:chromosome segregation protein SMC [Deltaproteobacteria bacterium]